MNINDSVIKENKNIIEDKKTKDIKLKEWHRQFIAEYVRNGCNASAAYKLVKPNSTEQSARSCAYALLQHINVKQEVKKLQEEIKKDIICDAKRRMEILSEIAQTGTETNKIKAIEALNKMEGIGSSTQNININSPDSYPLSNMNKDELLKLINGDDEEEDE